MFLNSVKYITPYFSSRSQLPSLHVLKVFKGISYKEQSDFIKDETKECDNLKLTISDKFKKIPYDEQYEQHDFKKDNKSYNFTKSNDIGLNIIVMMI
jgi:hypothetical protein